MGISNRVERLGQWLSGEFANRAQALENPAWFVQLQLWQRPTPLFGADSLTLFLEQANRLKLDQPYRQRLLRLTEEAGLLYGQYYQLKDFAAWRGAGQRPERLAQLQPSDLTELPGCRVAIATNAAQTQYRAALVPGGGCEFDYEGKLRQVIVGFEIDLEGAEVVLKTYDKGIDPKTGQGLWGALMGPYVFAKLGP